MSVELATEIRCSPEEVFRYVTDARNDPEWCRTVVACVQREGGGPGAGAIYEARHKPTPFHSVMSRTIEVIDYVPHRLMRSRQEDANGVFDVTYVVEPTPDGARLTQSDEIEWKVPAPVGGAAERLFVRRHIREQMEDLKGLLEGKSGTENIPFSTRAFGTVTGAIAPLARRSAGRKAQNAFTRAHTWILRRFGLASRIGSAPVLLLTTRGRRSGRARTVPLMYVPGPQPVLVASNGGSPTHPSWYVNLLDEPRVTVEIDGERSDAVARTVAGAERRQLWEKAVSTYPAYADYQRGTDRELPVVVLEPAREG